MPVACFSLSVIVHEILTPHLLPDELDGRVLTATDVASLEVVLHWPDPDTHRSRLPNTTTTTTAAACLSHEQPASATCVGPPIRPEIAHVGELGQPRAKLDGSFLATRCNGQPKLLQQGAQHALVAHTCVWMYRENRPFTPS